MGIAELDFMVGEPPRTSTIRASFTVVDISEPSYNGLIGCPNLTAVRAIVLPLYLKMKFSTMGGMGKVSRDQNMARRHRENHPVVMKATQPSGKKPRKFSQVERKSKEGNTK
ncbi:hypothetical protein LIER_23146 [Lithospermum erythrorhizon]|uniref:Uncharacterized protein n=1 Tax=Lithospermum erythrorhizon TaxID=34254 RepID=A0AAV3QXM8_LITER